MIIQPFPIYFDSNDYHVMLFFEDHQEYESIEAMVREQHENSTFIRAIITRKDGTQADHINDKSYVEMLENKKRKRDIYYTPIQYRRSEKKGKMHITLRFSSFKEEDIFFDFYTASKPSPKRAGLIDPGAHSGNISLPVMIPEQVTLAGPKSSITINGLDYRIPVKIKIPLLFKGMKGYYSEIFNIGVFRAGSEHLKILEAPSSFKAGEKWLYQRGNKMSAYTIEDARREKLLIVKDNEKIEAGFIDGNINIKKIFLFSDPGQSRGSVFSIEFEPFLPLKAIDSVQNNNFTFNISIDKHSALVRGRVAIDSSDGNLNYTLIPEMPEWSIKRPVSTTISKDNDLYMLKTEVGKR